MPALPFASLILLATASTMVGCATGAPLVGSEPTVVWENARHRDPIAQTPLSDAEARRIARAHDAAFSCEATARAMAKRDAERGWQVMHQCIQRHDFTDLELLVDSEWSDRVAAATDAASLMAHVVAVRGGDVESDLRLLRRHKVPLYSLQAALSEPDSYLGRYVLVRGSPRAGRTVDGGRHFQLVETKVMAESEWVTAPGSTRLSTKFQGGTADQPGLDVKRGRVDSSTSHQSEKVEVLTNVSVETGLHITARLPAGEPVLEPATDHIVVLKVGGVEKTEDLDGEVDEEPWATVVDFFEPESSRFARLGR